MQVRIGTNSICLLVVGVYPSDGMKRQMNIITSGLVDVRALKPYHGFLTMRINKAFLSVWLADSGSSTGSDQSSRWLTATSRLRLHLIRRYGLRPSGQGAAALAQAMRPSRRRPLRTTWLSVSAARQSGIMRWLINGSP